MSVRSSTWNFLAWNVLETAFHRTEVSTEKLKTLAMQPRVLRTSKGSSVTNPCRVPRDKRKEARAGDGVGSRGRMELGVVIFSVLINVQRSLLYYHTCSLRAGTL